MAREALSLLPSFLPRDGGGRAESSRDFPKEKDIKAVLRQGLGSKRFRRAAIPAAFRAHPGRASPMIGQRDQREPPWAG